METKNEIHDKKCYHIPEIEQVELDNEISLALASTPPAGPSEVFVNPVSLNNDPFRNNET